MKPENLALVRDAMVDVTRPGGTAARAGAGAPYTIAAKTGTAQVVGMKQGEKYDEKRVKRASIATTRSSSPSRPPTTRRSRSRSWWRTAATAARPPAPIAREVFDYYLLGKQPAAQAAARAPTRSEHD